MHALALFEVGEAGIRLRDFRAVLELPIRLVEFPESGLAGVADEQLLIVELLLFCVRLVKIYLVLLLEEV